MQEKKEKNKEKKEKQSPKVLVLGLDGATFDLITPWIKAGKLPGFKQLLAQSSHGILNSTIPPNTCPAWPSFYTGKNPGKFGLYYFTTIKPNSYDMHFYNFHDIKTPTLWDVLGDAGKKCMVLDIPTTYPAKPINGVMVSGGAHDLEKSVLPKSFKKQLPKDYLMNPEIFAVAGPQRYIKQNFLVTQQRIDLINKALTEDYDFIMCVLRITDYFAHRFWGSMISTNPDNPFKDMLLKAYECVDKFLLTLLERQKKEQFTLLVISDHGNGPITKKFYLNQWLIQEGYLHIKKEKISRKIEKWGFNQKNVVRLLKKLHIDKLAKKLPESWKRKVPAGGKGTSLENTEVDWENTTVFSHNDQIFINEKGKRPKGIVDPKDSPALRKEIKRKLTAFKDPRTQTSMGVQVYTKEEIYTGPYYDNAPDLQMSVGFRVAGKIGMPHLVEEIAETEGNFLTSIHKKEGIFFATGPDIETQSLKPLEIRDCFPTILHLFGLPVDKDVDGKVAKHIFKKTSKPGNQEVTYASTSPTAKEKERLDKALDAAIDQAKL